MRKVFWIGLSMLQLAVFPGLLLAEERFECSAELATTKQAKLLDSVEQRYRAVKSVSADFEQQSYFAGLDQIETSQGQVVFKTPGKMDWQYVAPQRQRFVADGKTLWFFQEEENQVTLGDFEESFRSDLPVSFLLGVGTLQESFSLKSACRAGEYLLAKLEPKTTDPGLQAFMLLVRPKDYVPVGAKILDVGGNETAIVLTDIKLNKSVQDARFKFSIPMGVDIIDRRKRVQLKTTVIESDVAQVDSP